MCDCVLESQFWRSVTLNQLHAYWLGVHTAIELKRAHEYDDEVASTCPAAMEAILAALDDPECSRTQ